MEKQTPALRLRSLLQQVYLHRRRTRALPDTLARVHLSLETVVESNFILAAFYGDMRVTGPDQWKRILGKKAGFWIDYCWYVKKLFTNVQTDLCICDRV